MTSVAAGTYVVSAKTTLAQTSSSGCAGTGSLVRCAVNGDPAPGANTTTDDYSETHVWRGVNRGRHPDAQHAGRGPLASTGNLTLRCWRSDAPTRTWSRVRARSRRSRWQRDPHGCERLMRVPTLAIAAVLTLVGIAAVPVLALRGGNDRTAPAPGAPRDLGRELQSLADDALQPVYWAGTRPASATS